MHCPHFCSPYTTRLQRPTNLGYAMFRGHLRQTLLAKALQRSRKSLVPYQVMRS
ncbi:MAG TPA: hypothetical protein V6C65_03900 [Allocoleopsis sp.]